jgi:hypothetical protein
VISRAYIQCKDNGDFLSEVSSTLWEGCDMLGIERVKYVPAEIDDLELSRETLVSGGVGMVRRALDRLGVPQPALYGIPPEPLQKCLGRHMWPGTMADVRLSMENEEHLFVKPLKRHKAFTGLVTGPQASRLARIATFEDDFEVAISEVMYFDVEYRLFVHDKTATKKWQVIDARYYRGNFRLGLDWDVVDYCLDAWKDAPVAYSLDMGVNTLGETRLVEVNDCMSLGTYGIPALPYAMMVTDRWEEVVGL